MGSAKANISRRGVNFRESFERKVSSLIYTFRHPSIFARPFEWSAQTSSAESPGSINNVGPARDEGFSLF